jgi:tripartite-type tricarboxylate transporter receptor subunit TctC
MECTFRTARGSIAVWFALLAPAKTPPQIVQTLNAELNKTIAKPQVVAKLEKWGRVIREAAIRIN